MWKIGKWFLGTLLGLCLLLTLLLYVFKDDIIHYVVKEVNKSLNAKVKVSRIDLTFWSSFPNLSVDFRNVFISDALPEATVKDTLLYSRLISLKFNPLDVWNENYDVKKVEIHPGTIRLKIDTAGNVNYNILKASKDTTASKFNLMLEEVDFSKIKFSYENAATGQSYQTNIDHLGLTGEFTEKRFTLEAKSKLYIDHVKSENVTLLANKPAAFDIAIQVDQEQEIFEIPRATVYISQLPFQLKARIDPKKLHFDVSARKLKLQEVASKLSSQLDEVRNYDGHGFCNFDLKVDGENKKEVVPNMVCTFDIQNGSLREPTQKLRISGISLNGKYSNEAGKRGEFIKLWNMRFNTASGPFQGEFLMTDFSLPHYQGKARGNLDLASIHGLFHIPYIDKITGNLDVNSQFDIQTNLAANGKQSLDVRKCTASMNMKEINASVVNDSRNFRSLNGFVGIEGDEAALQEIRVRIGGSDFKLNGIFQDIAPYIEKSGKLLANVDLQSSFIDMHDLSSTNVKEKAEVHAERGFVLPDNIDGTVLLNVGQLKYDSHKFNQLRSNLKVSGRLFTFSQLSLENAQANINGSLVVSETSPEILVVRSAISSNNIYFKNLFREWNNFDQDVIQENNISGKAHVDMDFLAPFDMRSGIQKNAVVSRIHIKITDGALKSVSTFKAITESLKTKSFKTFAEGFKSLSTGMILKQKDVNEFEKKLLDLKFQTLENTLLIQNGRLEIPLMEIKSSALDIETFGWHTFDNQIDYHFAFRFRDLKAKTSQTQSEFGIIQDDGTGVRIFMRMRGTTDNPIIEWDNEAQKEQTQENREAAKKEALSILKTEFGFRKGDTSISIYKPIKQPTEELQIDFSNSKEEPAVEQKKESEMKKKMKEKIRKLKESTKEEEVEFDVD